MLWTRLQLLRVLVLVGAVLGLSVCVRVSALQLQLRRVRATTSRDQVEVLVAVTQQNLEVLSEVCTNVSTPRHGRYGHYLTLHEVARLVAHKGHLRTVLKWLRQNKATDVHVVDTQDFVRATLTASVAEQMFGVHLHVFSEPTTREHVIFADRAYQLPEHVRGAIDHVSGIEPVDMENPVTFSPSPPVPARARRARAHTDGTRQRPAAAPGANMYFDSDNRVKVLFDQTCADGHLSQKPFPCSDDKDPIIAYDFVLTEVSSGTELSGRVDERTLAYYNFTPPHNWFTFLTYTFWIPNAAPMTYGHYYLNITTVNKSGARSEYWLDPDYGFLVKQPPVNPSLLHSMYNIPKLATNISANSQAVAVLFADDFHDFYLDHFENTFDLWTGASHDHRVIVDGYNDGRYSSLLVNVNLEMMRAIAPNVHTHYLYPDVKPNKKNFVLEWAANVSSRADAPLVHSMSYGIEESQITKHFGIPADKYASRTNAELLKMCARGLTVLVASGNAGSTDTYDQTGLCQISPLFPASSPLVTTVGSTARDPLAENRPNGFVGELVPSLANGQWWTTGGGFSTLPSQPRPAWQNKVVSAYLNNTAGLPSFSLFNSTGRAYPDLAMLGEEILMIDGANNNGFHGVEPGRGTEMSTAMVTGLIAHLNAARMAKGKPPVGFFNPLLYLLHEEHPEAFYDVRLGEISSGARLTCPLSVGFPARAGWDATSGVGSIADFKLLTELVLQY